MTTTTTTTTTFYRPHHNLHNMHVLQYKITTHKKYILPEMYQPSTSRP